MQNCILHLGGKIRGMLNVGKKARLELHSTGHLRSMLWVEKEDYVIYSLEKHGSQEFWHILWTGKG